MPGGEISESRLELIKVLTAAVVSIVLILAMTWIVITPGTDETQKGALVVIGSAVGFIFGRETR